MNKLNNVNDVYWLFQVGDSQVFFWKEHVKFLKVDPHSTNIPIFLGKVTHEYYRPSKIPFGVNFDLCNPYFFYHVP